MGDVVNLRQFRKAKERSEKLKLAEESRTKSGVSKAGRERQRAEEEQRKAVFRNHRLEPVEDDPDPA